MSNKFGLDEESDVYGTLLVKGKKPSPINEKVMKSRVASEWGRKDNHSKSNKQERVKPAFKTI